MVTVLWPWDFDHPYMLNKALSRNDKEFFKALQPSYKN